MVRLGRREFQVPLWVWAAVPLAAVFYLSVDLSFTSRGDLYYREPDRSYLAMMTQLGTASLAAFLFVDPVRRARVAWYVLPLVYLASSAGAVLVVSDMITNTFSTVFQTVVGAAIGLAASPRGAGGGGIVLVAITLAVPIVLAIGAAVFVTVASRIVTGLPLRTRGAWREFCANFLGAAIWLILAIGGYMAIRSSFNLAMGFSSLPAPRWLPYAAAGVAAAIATVLHLLLVRRSRREEGGAPQGHIRIWLLAAMCVLAFAYRPDFFGVTGVRAYYDHIKPALRAARIAPTPLLEVSGYEVDVVFHDYKTVRGDPLPDGTLPFISVRLPEPYGLTSHKYIPHVSVYRRDAPAHLVSSFWPERRKTLEAKQAEQPGEDAIVRFATKSPAIAMRLGAYPELEFSLSFFDPALPWDTAEDVLRRFVKERVHGRIGR